MENDFDHIAIIFNPMSSGDASRLARQLDDELFKLGYHPKLEPTKRAGHAIALARGTSLKYKRPLLISVSGDGGYNEVINGAMLAKAKNKNAKPVVAVLGAGNANDHYRVMQDAPLVELIKKKNVKPMDLISIKATTKDFELLRYAHSYIGLGITPEVGNELNRHGKSRFDEIKLILKTFMKFKPFKVTYEDRVRWCDSLVFANINEMAKIIKLDDKNVVNDDRFEVIEFHHHGKLYLLFAMLGAALFGIKNPPSYQTYTFKTHAKLPVQSDGEIDTLPSRSTVTIRSHGEAIDSLY